MRLTTLLRLTILIEFLSSASQPALADDETTEAEEVVQPGTHVVTWGGDAVDDTSEKVRGRVLPEEMIEIPQGMVLRPRDEDNRRTMFRPDQEYKCFPGPEWGQMGNLIVDYRWLWYYGTRMKAKVERLELQIANLQEQVATWKHNTESAERGLANMTGLLNKEHGYRLKLVKRERLELVMWRVGTIVALVAAGAFGAAWRVEKSK